MNRLFVNLIGKKREVNMAAYRIQNILHKTGYIAKIINPPSKNLILDVNKEIKIHHETRVKYATILKCCEDTTDDDFTYLNRYIREKGVFVRPCALYAVDYTDFSDEQIHTDCDRLFKKYQQLNVIFDVTAPIQKQYEHIELFTTL